LSHLEVIARGRLWRQLASRSIDRVAQRVNADLWLLSHLSALPVTVSLAATSHKPRCHQPWTLIPTPIQIFALLSLPHLTRAIPSMSEALWASNTSWLITLPTSRPERRYLESGITAESDEGPMMIVGIGIGAVATARRRSCSRSVNTPAALQQQEPLLYTMESS